MHNSPASTEARLAFSRPDRVDENIRALIATTGRENARDLHSAYFETLDEIQSRPLLVGEGDGGVDRFPSRIYRFETASDTAMLEYFLEESLTPTHLYGRDRRLEIERRVSEGRQLLREFDQASIRLLDGLVAKILFADKHGFGGASAGDMLGCIWLSPPISWGAADFAEALYHESLHQALFLEEMIRGVYNVEVETLSGPEGQVVSAIRKERRPFGASFHAACVAAGLIDLYRFLQDEERVESLVEGLLPSVEEIASKQRFLNEDGQSILADIKSRVS